MQASTPRTSKRFSSVSSPISQYKLFSASSLLNSTLELARVSVILIGSTTFIAAVLVFQQLLIQIYAACWQMALLFALLGLMVALLLGQYRLDQTIKTAKASIRWSALSSLTVTVLGIGVILCILNTAPPSL